MKKAGLPRQQYREQVRFADGKPVTDPVRAVWPSGVNPMTKKTRNHILHGEGNGKGGHLFDSGIPGKTEFPEHWDEDKIRDGITLALSAPDNVIPRGSKAQHRKLVDDVIIAVNVSKTKTGLSVITAFPVYPRRK